MRLRSTKAIGDPDIERLRAASRDETTAVELFEGLRWGGDPVCPTCGKRNVYRMTDGNGARHPKLRWRCRACSRQFTVRAATVMEESLLPLRCWAYAFWKACTSKKGIAALQLSRELDINYKSALFLLNRVQRAMAEWKPPPSGDGATDACGPGLSCGGGSVETSQTSVGGKPRRGNAGGRKPGCETSKMPVFVMVEHGGSIRIRMMPGIGGVKQRLTAKALGSVIRECVEGTSRRIADDYYSAYRPIGRTQPGGHFAVKHSEGEYVRKGMDIHSNSAEPVSSRLGLGVYGTCHSISKRHLPRYSAEFEFRSNTGWLEEGQSASRAVRPAQGRRLAYREPPTAIQTATGT
ncbi:MAG: IS1595 family transposase [Planctomycetia bacterium]|nr:IS1595 family transposase [Planctomycetia bacterium]